jgi:4-hydroxy-3-methylbut-2-en-1-yl diphosphate synthase IspG/GcpE
MQWSAAVPVSIPTIPILQEILGMVCCQFACNEYIACPECVNGTLAQGFYKVG